MKDLTASACISTGDILPLPVLTLHDMGLLRIVIVEDLVTEIEPLIESQIVSDAKNAPVSLARFRASIMEKGLYALVLQVRQSTDERWTTWHSNPGLVGEFPAPDEEYGMFMHAYHWATKIFSLQKARGAIRGRYSEQMTSLERFDDHVDQVMLEQAKG
jgi:hypothetical protein